MNALLPLLSGLGTGLALIVAIGVQNTYLLRLAVSARVRIVAAAVLVCAVSDAVLIVAGVLGVGAVVERFPVALVVIRFVGAAFLLTYGVLAARRALRPSGEAIRVAVEDDGVADVAPPAGHRAPMPAGATSVAGCGPDKTATTSAAAPTAHASASAAAPTAHASATAHAAEPARSTVTGPPVRTAPAMRAAVLTMLVFTWANPHVYLDTLVFLGSVANQQGIDDRWWWTAGAVAASCLWFSAVGFGGRLLRPLFARPVTWRVFDACVAVVMLAFGVLLVVGA
ncbi:LysE family transporter [Curtobacterium sp. VKM Ac-2922]|uniref:LysE/ArgO family amino acid transporter n=1 Tax=Curtobacterium sp. VKM Ac-2922 TaxID=2929475 RepID=UPI001FB1AAAF|nr:LysE family transporter [Curtobacterium sp. VKM Ac-2922]MCJ1712785.1 LysE family transporter [Curtobacterium sp. VKM Ac-2922]